MMWWHLCPTSLTMIHACVPYNETGYNERGEIEQISGRYNMNLKWNNITSSRWKKDLLFSSDMFQCQKNQSQINKYKKILCHSFELWQWITKTFMSCCFLFISFLVSLWLCVIICEDHTTRCLLGYCGWDWIRNLLFLDPKTNSIVVRLNLLKLTVVFLPSISYLQICFGLSLYFFFFFFFFGQAWAFCLSLVTSGPKCVSARNDLFNKQVNKQTNKQTPQQTNKQICLRTEKWVVRNLHT